MSKWVYSFGAGHNEGRADMRNLLGGKGANLAEMAAIGLPVPPGFTITTEVCTAYYDHNETYPADLKAQADPAADTTALLKRYPKAQVRDLAAAQGRLTELDAVIAYLQQLGTQVDFKIYDNKANIR
jgi:phosphoenolpyruvate synthase/pyruvate phosphate dikinase